MRQIYLLASDVDASSASEVEALLKQRGYMVRRAEEKFGFPPARPQEITLALWSKAAQFSVRQILFTNRAIDAWTEGRLILAKLDHAFAPRGLSDVAMIDLTFVPARMAAVWKIVEAAQEIDRAQEARRQDTASGPDDDGGAPGPDGSSEAGKLERLPNARRKKKDTATGLSAGIGLVVGLVTAGALGSLGFLVLPFASQVLLGAAALAWGAVAGAAAGTWAAGRASPRRVTAAMPAPAPQAPARAPGAEESADPVRDEADSPVFVSYARKDGGVVYPLVAEVEAGGRRVWIDRDEIHAGGNWAGMIVRAIRESDTFCLMCSAESFQSDNVRREIYIADKYKRKLLPVRLDSSEMPEDFEYFLIDRQWLDLTAIEPAEQAVRLKAALSR